MLGASHVVQAGQDHQLILSWSYPLSQDPANSCVYTVDESGPVVVFVTYDILVDPSVPFDPAINIGAAFLIMQPATDEGRGGVVHQEVEVDLRRGVQIAFPALSIAVYASYPRTDPLLGIVQPDLLIKASVGRGGHGCGCPTRTIPIPEVGAVARIPVLAYSAVLISPTAVIGALFNQYPAPGGPVISSAVLESNSDDEVLIAPGALFFNVTGAPAGSFISFQLAA